jgi:hypothetical protein
MFFDLFDLYQQGKIREARETAETARDQAQQLRDRISKLERRSDQLALACQALWEMLREERGLTDNDLIARMQQIDLRDGAADGRMTPMPVECPQCKRRSNSRRDECVYCGARLPGRNVMERLQG